MEAICLDSRGETAAVATSWNPKIANASVLAVGMVVGIHTAGREIGVFENGCAMWWWLALGMYGIFQTAVPFFFICSGYFLAGHMNEKGWYGCECHKRVWSLLTPYLLWSVLYAALQSAAVFGVNLSHGQLSFMDMGVRSWIHTFGISPFEYPRLCPLWYVRTLMIFVILSPLLEKVVKATCGLWYIVILFLLSIVFEVYHLPQPIDFVLAKSFSLFGLFFFVSGMYLRLKPIPLPEWSGFALLGGLCVVLGNACLWSWLGMSFFSRTLCSVLLIWGLWKFIPERPFPKWLTNSTFAVFLMHPFVFYLWDCISIRPVETIPMWLLKWVVGFGGSVVVAHALRRFWPAMAKIAFGRR